MTTETLERAEEALKVVRIDPRRAVDMATVVNRQAGESGDLAAQSVAERALGLAAAEVEDLEVAVAHLRRSVRLARRGSSDVLAAMARISLAGALTRQGHPAAALREIDAALPRLTVDYRSRAVAQRALVLYALGRRDEAMSDFGRALRELRRRGDLAGIERVLANRAVLLVLANSYVAADRDLREARRLCDELGLQLDATAVEENLVLVRRRLGDVPGALEHLDAAEQLSSSLDVPIGSLLIERSELLLSVNLVEEARAAAEAAVQELQRVGMRLDVPQARLVLAQTAGLIGEQDRALRELRLSAREFTAHRQLEWAALARALGLLAQLHTAEAPQVSVPALRRAAQDAERSGWVETATDTRLATAFGLGGRHDAVARFELGVVGATRRRGPAVRRVKGWLATSLLRRQDGDFRGAEAAAWTGLRILEDHRATMAATDLRARVAGLGSDLAALGLDGALASGSAYQVLRWAEAGRARHLIERPVRPPAQSELAERLGELRAVVADIEDHQRGGQPIGTLVARQVRLEQLIRDLTRRQRSALPASRQGGSVPCARDLTEPLAGAAMVELVLHGGALYAVTLAHGPPRLTRLGDYGPIRELVRWLPFGLRRLARAHAGRSSREAAVAMLRDVAGRLDRALLGPLRVELGDRELVVVPTHELQSLPWSLLPSMAGRPVTVTPSAALWLRAMARRPGTGQVVVVAGPGLPGAEMEAMRVSAIHGVEPLTGAAATVETVSAAISGATIAHLATHGTVRADNPLFSALRLHDGPLTVYDLEAVDVGPDTVVLAACESGRNLVLAGDELLGLSAAFLARDTRHLVASVVPVPDAETAPLMVAFHQQLRTGLGVADALARAQGAVDAGEPAAFAAAAGFICLGAGLSPVAVSDAVTDTGSRPRDTRA